MGERGVMRMYARACGLDMLLLGGISPIILLRINYESID